MTRFSLVTGLSCGLMVLSSAAVAQTPGTLTIDAAHVKTKVSPTLYGLMTEEINYSYDGGLYGELVSNRTFQEGGSPNHWMLRPMGSAEATMQTDTKEGPSAALTRSLALTVIKATPTETAGVANVGFWGIPVRPRTVYHASFYAKASSAAMGPVMVKLVDNDTGMGPQAASTPLTTEWKRYEVTLTSGEAAASSTNQLVLSVGPLVDRPTHPSPWRYRSSDGLGLLEFLEWCEDLQMQPLLAVYAGYSMRQEYVKPGPDLEPYVQDALDEIEYVTGGAETKWGAERVKDGHPAPFAMQYVEVGNEDWFDKSGSYDGRYAQYYKAIKSKYPNLQIIATTTVKGIRPDVIDDHYYRPPSSSTRWIRSTTRWTGRGRRSLWASGRRARAARRRTSGPRWAMRRL